MREEVRERRWDCRVEDGEEGGGCGTLWLKDWGGGKES